MNRIVVTKDKNKYIVIFIINDKAVKIRAINSLDEYADSVYLGRIKTVKKNIDSSFVSFNNGKIGFINSSFRKPETVFPVMVKKTTDKTKEDKLTDKIMLSGIYVVTGQSIKELSISSKISDENKIKINNLINNDTKAIIRTNAANVDIDSVLNELNYILKQYEHIIDISDKRTENTILYKGLPSIIKTIFSEDISYYDEILSDCQDFYELYSEFEKNYHNLGIDIPIKIKKYDDDNLSLASFLSISSKIDEATNKKVYLKSDAYIYIEHTEAMTVIDVNSGTTRFKGEKDQVIHSINMEAAKEVVRQLKLRNLSGIIIIDFINVKDRKLNDELVGYVNDLLKSDDAHAKCYGMTKLSLMEITRDKKELTLKEQLEKI